MFLRRFRFLNLKFLFKLQIFCGFLFGLGVLPLFCPFLFLFPFPLSPFLLDFLLSLSAALLISSSLHLLPSSPALIVSSSSPQLLLSCSSPALLVCCFPAPLLVFCSSPHLSPALFISCSSSPVSCSPPHLLLFSSPFLYSFSPFLFFSSSASCNL